MAGSFTDSFENAVLDNLFSGAALPTGTYSVGLFTTAPADSTSGTEVSGTSYARQATGSWSSASGGAISNSADITFPTAGTGGWGTIVAIGVFKGTTLIAHSDVTPKQITAGDTVTIKAGDLDITLD